MPDPTQGLTQSFTMTDPTILYPLLALVTWTFVMWVWLYVTRIPAIQKANVDMEELRQTGSPLVLPADVSRVADNYNHLHEQPTLFYALTLAAAVMGIADPISTGIAWLYVMIRIVHSLIQATKNVIFVRFCVFALASVVLFSFLLRIIYLSL